MASFNWLTILTTSEWVNVHDALSIATGTAILIQNVGVQPLIAAEATTVPSNATTEFGTFIPKDIKQDGTQWESSPGVGDSTWVWATFVDGQISVQTA
ncbi:MAG: hypothetical protein V3R25_05805 [Nitrosomonadaceae bacterium]